jgi:hypothetical protein
MYPQHELIKRTVWLLGALLLTSAGCFLWYFEIFPSPRLSAAPSWNGIIPGQTTLGQAYAILGKPDRTVLGDQYGVDIYQKREELGWEYVELWYEHRENAAIIVGVFRAIAYPIGGKVPTLDEIVIQYGRPEEVSWSNSCRSRFLLWASEGIASVAYAEVDLFDWNELHIGSILLFEPMSTRQFMRMKWSLPLFASQYADHNTCIGDAPDTLPEDPYDWAHMPTPSK